jgi:hypothetical protein
MVQHVGNIADESGIFTRSCLSPAELIPPRKTRRLAPLHVEPPDALVNRRHGDVQVQDASRSHRRAHPRRGHDDRHARACDHDVAEVRPTGPTLRTVLLDYNRIRYSR